MIGVRVGSYKDEEGDEKGRRCTNDKRGREIIPVKVTWQ